MPWTGSKPWAGTANYSHSPRGNPGRGRNTLRENAENNLSYSSFSLLPSLSAANPHRKLPVLSHRHLCTQAERLKAFLHGRGGQGFLFLTWSWRGHIWECNSYICLTAKSKGWKHPLHVLNPWKYPRRFCTKLMVNKTTQSLRHQSDLTMQAFVKGLGLYLCDIWILIENQSVCVSMRCVCLWGVCMSSICFGATKGFTAPKNPVYLPSHMPSKQSGILRNQWTQWGTRVGIPITSAEPI